MPAGRPKGSLNDKPWQDAIRRAVNEVREGENGAEKRIFTLARKLVDQAIAGDVPALKEIGDRLDGKPVQGIDAKVDGTLTVNVNR